MDNRLVFLTALLVTLSWTSVGTYAQTAAATTPKATTAAVTTPKATTAAVTTPKATTAAATTPKATTAAVTTPKATTAAVTTPKATTAAVTTPKAMTAAVTTPKATTAAVTTPKATTPKATTPKATTAAATTPKATTPKATTAAATTPKATTPKATTPKATTAVAPPITPNTNVTTLLTPINRADCGKEQLCTAQPSDCDPSTSSSCFFLAAKQISGRNFEFGLSGESDGYLAGTLSLDNILGDNDTTYVCANNNGVVKLFGTVLDNGKLTLRDLPVDSVKGKITGKKIQCTFSATVPAQRARASQVAIAISTGTFNSSTNALGDPITRLKSLLVDLANPNTTVTNETTTGTAAPAVTTAPPITTNSTVTELMTPINRADCGIGELCATQPSDCDPSTSSSCFFLAAKQSSGRNFDIGLSGESDGYLAGTLSLDSELGGNDTTYVCANNNGVVKLFGTVLNNGKLTLRDLPVDSVKGKITGKKIQCTFSATVPAQITRASQVAIAISTGTFNSSTNALGDPITQLKSPLVDLANPNTTVTNETTTGTAAPAVTTAPPITTNSTVTELTTPINRADCGIGRLCAAQPSDCDPSTSSSCFFLAAKQSSGRNFEFGLSGESDGYLAGTLSLDNILGGNDTTYVCANNNGVVKFFGAVLDNGKLTLKDLPVDSVKGKITGKKIQCTFSATVPAQRARASQIAIAISTGTFNSSTNALGDPITHFKSSLVDLENANATVTNELSTTSHAITIQQSLTQALLFTVGVLGLTVL